MNQVLSNHIAVEGIDNALALAKQLMLNDYQVFMQLDDMDIYIVSYEYNDPELGSERFASVTLEEEEELLNRHRLEKVKSMFKYDEMLRDEVRELLTEPAAAAEEDEEKDIRLAPVTSVLNQH